MTVNEIFSELSTHMIQGMMVHEQLMQAFRFLSLPGFAKCHEYHYLDESIGRNALLKFAMDRYGYLIQDGKVEDPGVIPTGWYGLSKQEVSISQRVQAIVGGFGEWINWESETLNLYESAYRDLLSLNEIDAANFVNKYIDDVSKELIYAKNERLAIESTDCDLPFIVEEQEAYEKRFTKKLRKLKGV